MPRTSVHVGAGYCSYTHRQIITRTDKLLHALTNYYTHESVLVRATRIRLMVMVLVRVTRIRLVVMVLVRATRIRLMVMVLVRATATARKSLSLRQRESCCDQLSRHHMPASTSWLRRSQRSRPTPCADPAARHSLVLCPCLTSALRDPEAPGSQPCAALTPWPLPRSSTPC